MSPCLSIPETHRTQSPSFKSQTPPYNPRTPLHYLPFPGLWLSFLSRTEHSVGASGPSEMPIRHPHTRQRLSVPPLPRQWRPTCRSPFPREVALPSIQQTCSSHLCAPSSSQGCLSSAQAGLLPLCFSSSLSISGSRPEDGKRPGAQRSSHDLSQLHTQRRGRSGRLRGTGRALSFRRVKAKAPPCNRDVRKLMQRTAHLHQASAGSSSAFRGSHLTWECAQGARAG